MDDRTLYATILVRPRAGQRRRRIAKDSAAEARAAETTIVKVQFRAAHQDAPPPRGLQRVLDELRFARDYDHLGANDSYGLA